VSKPSGNRHKRTSKYKGGLVEYKKIEDQLTVSNKAKPTRDEVRDTQKLRKGLDDRNYRPTTDQAGLSKKVATA
jgi:hypothetical protein